MPVPSACTGSLLEWAKAVAGWKVMAGSAIAEGEVGRVVELQRGGQVEAGALLHDGSSPMDAPGRRPA